MAANSIVENMTQVLPAVPLTIEGASVLHQIMRVRWPIWKALPAGERASILAEAIPVLAAMETRDSGQSGVFSVLGHKGDLLLVHFRDSFEQLNEAELLLNRLRLWDYLEPAHSYLSVVELGLYDSSVKAYGNLAARGIEPHSP